jgi:outer membrane lipase/esterase
MSFSLMRKGLAALMAGLALAALASCGGGGQIEPFEPNRILAFGDELSVIEADGRKYSINSYGTKTENGTTVDDPTKLDCTLKPIWVQTVASSVGLVFDRCLGTATAASGQIMAQVGHKVGDLAAQRAAVQGAALNDNDLALVLVGMHDILELYAQYPARSRDALLDDARQRGATLGAFVNNLAQTGPAVVVLTVPDLGLTPYALAQNTSTGDATRSKLLSDLTAAFNNRMSVTMINDGRLIGLVFADVETQTEAKFPTSFFGSTGNATQAACLETAPLPGCTPGTLVTDATTANRMWADALHPGPVTHNRLGSLAASRANNNPF